MISISEIIDIETRALRNIMKISKSVYKVAVVLDDHIQAGEGKIVISGMGKAGYMGKSLAASFSSTGSPSVFLHPSEAQHGDLGIIQSKDILFLFSNSGKTKELIELVVLARNLYRDIKVITVTSTFASVLAIQSDYVIPFNVPVDEVDSLGLVPTTSTTLMKVIGDILVVLLMERRGFTKEDFAKRHHGGYLGQKIREEL